MSAAMEPSAGHGELTCQARMRPYYPWDLTPKDLARHNPGQEIGHAAAL
jgi:hypothetical protein